MRCVDCLPLIEEYFDGETDARTAASVGAHLSACADCAAALDALRFEQDVYVRYDRGLEVTPALWAAVSARVARGPEPTKEADGPSFLTRLRETLAVAFGALALRPAFASTLALLFVALTAGALWLSLARRPAMNKQLAAVQSGDKNANVSPSPSEPNLHESLAAVTPDEGPTVVGTPRREDPQRDLGARVERVGYAPGSDRRAPELDVVKLINEPLTPTSRNVVVIKPDDHDARQDAALLLNVASDERGVVTTSAQLAEPGDEEIAQHVEKAQMLLRSIKNAQPAVGDTVNLAYEKNKARRLLAENATLQLDAETRGDKDTQKVLDRIEPFLLDIANLGDQPSRAEVRSIKERVQKDEIIAALQVY